MKLDKSVASSMGTHRNIELPIARMENHLCWLGLLKSRVFLPRLGIFNIHKTRKSQIMRHFFIFSTCDWKTFRICSLGRDLEFRMVDKARVSFVQWGRIAGFQRDRNEDWNCCISPKKKTSKTSIRSNTSFSTHTSLPCITKAHPQIYRL
jgi:hypothetical protein